MSFAYYRGQLFRLKILRIRSGGPNLRYFPRANEEPSSFYPLFPIQRMAWSYFSLFSQDIIGVPH